MGEGACSAEKNRGGSTDEKELLEGYRMATVTNRAIMLYVNHVSQTFSPDEAPASHTAVWQNIISFDVIDMDFSAVIRGKKRGKKTRSGTLITPLRQYRRLHFNPLNMKGGTGRGPGGRSRDLNTQVASR